MAKAIYDKRRGCVYMTDSKKTVQNDQWRESLDPEFVTPSHDLVICDLVVLDVAPAVDG